MLLHAPALAWRGCSDPYKTLAGVVRNAHRSMLAIRRATQKTSKNRADSFLNEDFGQEHAKIRSWSAPKPILEGFGCLPSASWAALGRSWDALGPFWAPLGHFLGVSCALLDASWLPNAAQEGPGLDFGGFRECPGRLLEVPKLIFSRFFRTFRYNVFNNAVTTLLHFPALCLLPFWCGGLRAALPPPPGSVPDARYKCLT